MSDIRELLNIGGGNFCDRLDVSPPLRAAWRLVFDGECAEAETRFRRIVAEDKRNAEALAGLAICVAEDGGRFISAEKLAKMAVRFGKRSPAGYLALGYIHLRASRLEEGYRYLMKARHVAPRDPRLRAGLVWYEQERPPVIADLDREHVINRTLGGMRQALGTPARRAAAAMAVGVCISLTRAIVA
jgi:Flp pilus assembly protein TadD